MPNDNIIIPDVDRLEEIKRRIMADGPERLHVVSDFESTLTPRYVKGKKVVSMISILRDGNYLTSDYPAKAHALYDKYHPVEIDSEISTEEKNKLMHEWWSAHYQLLAQSGLNKNDLKRVVAADSAVLRAGAVECLEFLQQHKIPLVIISAAGLGTDAVSLFFEKFNKLHDNIFIVSNLLNWGEDGKFFGVAEPIIHSTNKNYSSIKKFPFWQKVANRKNVILFGNSIDDTKMVNDFDCDNLIKIGFLNEDVENKLDEFKRYFDVIILNDGPMDFVNSMLKEIITNQVRI